MKRIILFLVASIGIIVFLNSCSKEYSFETPTPPGNAIFSFKDSLGNCLPDSVHGTFYNGVLPGSDTAYVEVQVRVDSIGSYAIYTDDKTFQNGLMFADSGYFSTTGYATIKLKPIGQAIFHEPIPFTISSLSDSTVCSFTVYVQDSTGTGLGGGGTDTTSLSDTAWKFSVDAATFNGPVDSAFIYSDTSGAKFLTLYGYTPATGDSAFAVSIYLPSGEIADSSYSTTTSAGVYFKDVRDTVSTHYIYHADPTTTNALITITLTYDSVNNIVEGTFSGTAVDLSGNVITISNGRFRAKVT